MNTKNEKQELNERDNFGIDIYIDRHSIWGHSSMRHTQILWGKPYGNENTNRFGYFFEPFYFWNFTEIHIQICSNQSLSELPL